jgi:hypothetical protein
VILGGLVLLRPRHLKLDLLDLLCDPHGNALTLAGAVFAKNVRHAMESGGESAKKEKKERKSEKKSEKKTKSSKKDKVREPVLRFVRLTGCGRSDRATRARPTSPRRRQWGPRRPRKKM